MGGGTVELDPKMDVKLQPSSSGYSRIISVQHPSQNAERFPVDNNLSSRKYPNWIAFLPMNLWEQFQKPANVYFLLICILCSITIISPISPASTIMGLCFVLFLTMAKDGFEDWKRVRSDVKTNAFRTTKWDRNVNSWQATTWADIKVGDLVQVSQDEQVPADLLIIASRKFTDDDANVEHNSNGLVSVNTKGLDGETSLRMRVAGVQAISQEFWRNPTFETLSSKVASVECSAPNGDLSTLDANINMVDGETVLNVDRNAFVLRGTIVEQTLQVWGLVIYTGQESKLVKNNQMETRRKVTQLEYKLHDIVYVIFFVTLVVCLALGIGMAVWCSYQSTDAWYLMLDDNSDSTSGYFDPDSVYYVAMVGFGTWMILQAYMIPISLYVTLEMIKLLMASWVGWDLSIYSKEMDQRANCKNSSVMEELGQVQYIISDKTGTLTQNKMALLKMSCISDLFGSGQTEIDIEVAKQRGEPVAPRRPADKDNFLFYDDRISNFNWLANKSKLEQPVRERVEHMLLAMALSHDLHLVKSKTDETVLNGVSPDEIALVLAASKLGMVFADLKSIQQESTDDSVKQLTINQHVADGTEIAKRHFQVLYNLEFTSERKCASVIVRMPQAEGGAVRCYLKGADSKVEKMINDSENPDVKQTRVHIDEMANSGLRTLMYAYRDIAEEEFSQWEPQYKAALCVAKTEGSEKKKEKLMSLIETGRIMDKHNQVTVVGQGPVVLGAIGIEDRLQEQVGATLKTLAQTGVQTWVCTGDKEETAVMIGYACELLQPPPNRSIQSEEASGGMDLIRLNPLDAGPASPSKWPFGVASVPPYPKQADAGASEKDKAEITGCRQICRLQAITEYFHRGSKICPKLRARGEGPVWYRQKPECLDPPAVGELDWQHDICRDSYEKLTEQQQAEWNEVHPMKMKCTRGMTVPSGALMQVGIGVMEDTVVKHFELIEADACCIPDADSSELSSSETGGATKQMPAGDPALVSHRKLREWQKQFIRFASEFKSVVACRLQPMQKKELVHLLKTECGQITLAIGDGNNDVAMIKEAHVGVGIAGVEGTQAVQNADFSINQFRFVGQLMLVHGRWAYQRLGLIVTYFFYKNVVFSYSMVWHAFLTGFSAVSMYDDWVLTLYNVAFTAFGVIAIGFFEQDISARQSLSLPGCLLYKDGHTNVRFNISLCCVWVAEGMVHAGIIFLFAYYYMAMVTTDDGITTSMYDLGNVCMTCLIFVVTFRLALDTLHFTVFHHICYWGIIVLWFLWSFLYATVDPVTWGWNLAGYYYSFINISSMITFWLTVPLVTVTCVLPKYAYKSYIALVEPTHLDNVRLELSKRVAAGCCACIPPMDPLVEYRETLTVEDMSAGLMQPTSPISASKTGWFRGGVVRNFDEDQGGTDLDRLNVQDLVLGRSKPSGDNWFRSSTETKVNTNTGAEGEHACI